MVLDSILGAAPDDLCDVCPPALTQPFLSSQVEVPCSESSTLGNIVLQEIRREVEYTILVAKPAMCFYEDSFLFVCPGLPLYVRPQLVMPALPALLSYPSRKVPCNRTPLAFPLRLDKPVTAENSLSKDCDVCRWNPRPIR